MLATYQSEVQALLQAPNSPQPLVSEALLTSNINIARNQVAGEGECIRNYATLIVGPSTQQYPFSEITLAANSPGVGAVLNVRKAARTIGIGPGQVRMFGREFEWFENFVLAQSAPLPGPPRYWAQYGQGTGGTIFVSLPDGSYTLALDCVCLPVALQDDTTPEAIPELWQDAVPYYAAWLSMQDLQRQADAEIMMKRFEDLMGRARRLATPSVLPHQFAGGPDLVLQGRLGMQPGRQAQ